MSSARRTFVWMGTFSAVTLVLGLVRELVIARDLQASGEADLFFRGAVVVGAVRNLGAALFRSRWIPVGAGPGAWELLRRESGTIAWVSAAALVVLLAIARGDLSATTWVFALAVVAAVIGSAVRALAERAGQERRGYLLEWALPVGAIAGALAIGHGALGPAIGIAAGTVLGLAAMSGVVLRDSAVSVVESGIADDPTRTRWLLLDTVAYVNLGLLDALVSPWIYDEGAYALLQYGYLFVNAALVVPTAAATLVALRIAARDDVGTRRRLGRWSLLAGLGVAGLNLVAWVLLGWDPVAQRIDAAAGWAVCEAVAPVVLFAMPFAALRLANTVGRQTVVAHDPARLIFWDLAGLGVRAVLLVGLAGPLGVLSSPLAVAAGELLQLFAWLPGTRRHAASS